MLPTYISIFTFCTNHAQKTPIGSVNLSNLLTCYTCSFRCLYTYLMYYIFCLIDIYIPASFTTVFDLKTSVNLPDILIFALIDIYIPACCTTFFMTYRHLYTCLMYYFILHIDNFILAYVLPYLYKDICILVR